MKELFIKFKNRHTSIPLSISFIKWVSIGTIVGISVGSACAIFLYSLEAVTNYRLQYSYLLFLLPFGGAFVSFLYSKYGKNSSKGNNLIIEKINDSSASLPLVMAPLVFLGTIITHLLGGSAGREGTGVQIGASISEFIGRILKLDKTDIKIILMVGISCGFASVFGTPLAGTVFGLEIAAFGVMSYEALLPCFIASIVGNSVTIALGIHHSTYSISGIPELNLIIIIKIIFAAILFGFISKIFSELTHAMKSFFSSKINNPAIRSFIGGLLIISLVYLLNTRDFLGLSLPLISNSFTSSVHPLTFLGKMIFTSLTLGTGFQGGEVTPIFVIGSTFGNTLSTILDLSPSFLAALGLIGVFVGATNSPISSFILGIELFGSQAAIYIFMTCVISYIFSGHTGIYPSQKIGKSKSKLIKTKSDSTLSSFKNSRKNVDC